MYSRDTSHDCVPPSSSGDLAPSPLLLRPGHSVGGHHTGRLRVGRRRGGDAVDNQAS